MIYTSKEIEERIESIRSALYETYQMEWIDKHIGDEEFNKEYDAFYADEELVDMYKTFHDYVESVGFENGSVYAELAVFLQNEYQDADWRKSHLSERDEDFLVKFDDMVRAPSWMRDERTEMER